jgi:hypothetical protein
MTRAALLAMILGSWTAWAQETRTESKTAPSAIPREKYEGVLKLVKPYPGEYAWRDDIPWEITLSGAQEKAAAQDKPILLLRSNDGPPFGAV